MKKLFLLVASIVALSIGAGSAAAAPHETPTGYTGALNMLNDSTMTTVPMGNDAAQGNAGMFHATCVTAGFGCP